MDPADLLAQATQLLGGAGPAGAMGSTISTVVLGIVAALWGVLALLFLGLAGMWLLDEAVPLWVAALLVGIVFLAPAIVFGLALRRVLRRKRASSPADPLADPMALLSSLLPPTDRSRD